MFIGSSSLHENTTHMPQSQYVFIGSRTISKSTYKRQKKWMMSVVVEPHSNKSSLLQVCPPYKPFLSYVLRIVLPYRSLQTCSSQYSIETSHYCSLDVSHMKALFRRAFAWLRKWKRTFLLLLGLDSTQDANIDVVDQKKLLSVFFVHL